MAFLTLKARWIPAADFKKGRGGRKIATIILHSTDGRKAGDIPTLTLGAEPQVSCHFYVTRDGLLYQFVKEEDTAYHAGKVRQLEYSNSQTIGIEQEHIDGQQDWPDVQVATTAMVVAYLRQKHGRLPVLGHAAIADPPGRKADPEGFKWGQLSSLVDGYALHVWELERT